MGHAACHRSCPLAHCFPSYCSLLCSQYQGLRHLFTHSLSVGLVQAPLPTVWSQPSPMPKSTGPYSTFRHSGETWRIILTLKTLELILYLNKPAQSFPLWASNQNAPWRGRGASAVDSARMRTCSQVPSAHVGLVPVEQCYCNPNAGRWRQRFWGLAGW